MKSIKHVLFGTLILIIAVSAFAQRQRDFEGRRKDSPPAINTYAEWTIANNQLNESKKISAELEIKISDKITELNELKKSQGTESKEFEKVLKRREIAKASQELHDLIQQNNNIMFHTYRQTEHLAQAAKQLTKSLDEELQDKKTSKKKAAEIEKQIETMNAFQESYKETKELFSEQEIPGNLPEGQIPPIPDMQDKMDEMKNFIAKRLAKKLEKLERENEFLLEQAKQNAEEIKEIKQLLETGKMPIMRHWRDQGMRGQGMQGMRGEGMQSGPRRDYNSQRPFKYSEPE